MEHIGNLRIFVLGKPFQLSLMFEGKARAYRGDIVDDLKRFIKLIFLTSLSQSSYLVMDHRGRISTVFTILYFLRNLRIDPIG